MKTREVELREDPEMGVHVGSGETWGRSIDLGEYGVQECRRWEVYGEDLGEGS